MERPPVATKRRLDLGEAAVKSGLSRGLSPREIAASVWEAMKAPGPPGRPATDPAQYPEIIEEFRQGRSVNYVRQHYGIGNNLGWKLQRYVKENL